MEFLEPWIPYLAALGGLGSGILATWFVCRTKTQTLRARFEERSKAANKAVADLEAGCANLEAEVRQLRHSEAISLKRQAELEILAQTQLRGLEEKQQLLREAEQRLAHNLHAVTSEALKATQHEFLQLARSSFDSQKREATSELEQRRVAVETLVKPVAATLHKVETRIGDLEKARRDTESALRDHVQRMASAQAGLQKETAQLAQALRQPAGRGGWGEVQLKRVVELAGMQAYCDFQAPPSSDAPSETPHPDMLVNLPTGRRIAVDAQAPLEACLAAAEAADEEARNREGARFSEAIAQRLATLASPAYRALCGDGAPPEFTVLFLPSESFLSTALAHDPGLLERGIQRGVLLATPSTLVVLLRAAAVGWRQEGIAEKARIVSEAGRELYAQVSTLAERVAKVGCSLDATVQNFNSALGSLEHGVLPGARKLSDLGVPVPTGKLPTVPEITPQRPATTQRPLQASPSPERWTPWPPPAKSPIPASRALPNPAAAEEESQGAAAASDLREAVVKKAG